MVICVVTLPRLNVNLRSPADDLLGNSAIKVPCMMYERARNKLQQLSDTALVN